MAITLYTASTPNGWKASVTLEELGLPYTVHPIQLDALDQKKDWFLALNPNGRIPVIVDHDNDNFAVFESGAILLYLAEKAGKLCPNDVKGRSVVMQWLMFQMSGVGPMMGQANVFHRYAPEKMPWAIERYQRESRRLFEVLDRRLTDHEWLADDYSIADIANFCWVRTWSWSGANIDGLDGLAAWIERIAKRPAVIRGLEIPEKRPQDPADTDALVSSAQKMLA